MSQTDLIVSNDSGANVRTDFNANLQALGSLMSGTSAPGTTYAGMFWLDTTNHLLKRRNEANNAWITVAKFDETNNLPTPYAWNAALDDAFETLASSGTTNLATPVSRNVTITGTTTITAFGTVKAGSIRHLRFEGALTLTHNGTSLILPGGANITTAANDTAIMYSLGSGNWLCLNYKRQSGLPIVAPATVVGYEVQKVRTELTSTLNDQGGTGGTFYAVTGLAVTITPAAGNDVRIRGFLTVSGNVPQCVGVRIKRDSTVLLAGAGAGSRTSVLAAGGVTSTQMACIPFDILDVAPGTSAFVYSVEAVVDQSQTFNVNRTDADGDAAPTFRPTSVIEAIEIKR